MLRLLLTELRYQHRIVVWTVFIAVAFLVTSYAVTQTNFSHFVLPYLGFIAPYLFFVEASKEQHSRLYASVPLSLRSIALYRLGVVVISILFYFLMYIAMNLWLYEESLPNMKNLLLAAGLIVGIYGCAYIYRDFFREIILHKNITREKVAPILILIGIILQVFFLATLIGARSSDGDNALITRMVDWLAEHFPFRGQFGYIRALVFGGLAAFLSIYTFKKSKVRY